MELDEDPWRALWWVRSAQSMRIGEQVEGELEALKLKWQITKTLKDEQTYLTAWIRNGSPRFVYLDPDGTMRDWLAVVVRRETGIVYGTQCSGTRCEERFVEGYLVLLGGSKYDADRGIIETAPFNDVFHDAEVCRWSWAGASLPKERALQLQELVHEIPYWSCHLGVRDIKGRLQLDLGRMDDIAEGWIPVYTPDGSGVLLHKNCD
jgi:Family of unknown function (DUF6210)